MKKPKKIVKWLPVEQEQDGIFVDYNGKPKHQYIVKLPYWLCRAYRPRRVKVEIREKLPCYADLRNEENHEEYREYFKKNWRKKMQKMRKLNHGYIFVTTRGMGEGWFNSIEDYNNYHKELKALNAKYLGNG